jgi:hypothetical protein
LVANPPKIYSHRRLPGKTLWDNGWLYIQYRNFWNSYPDSLILDPDPGFAEPRSNPDSDLDLDLDQDFCYNTSIQYEEIGSKNVCVKKMSIV